MENMTIIGIATATTALVMTGLAASIPATPIAVDSAYDQQPDESLYGLEKAGESIKRSLGVGPSNAELYEERMNEWINMVRENKGGKYLNVMNEGQEKMLRMTERARNRRGLTRAENMLEYHVSVLENLKDNLPLEARNGIETAIQSSSGVLGKVRQVKENTTNGPTTPIREDLKEQIKDKVDNSIRESKGIGR